MSSYLLTGFRYIYDSGFPFLLLMCHQCFTRKRRFQFTLPQIKILHQLRKVLQRVQKVLAKVNFLKGHAWSAMLCSYTSNKWKPALIRATVEDYRKNFTVIKITKCPEFPLDCISAFCDVSIQCSLASIRLTYCKSRLPRNIIIDRRSFFEISKRKNFSQRRGKFKQNSWNPESSTSGRSCLN